MRTAGTGDSIQFESRSEIREILKALYDYSEKHESAPDEVKRLIDLLEVMEMVW